MSAPEYSAYWSQSDSSNFPWSWNPAERENQEQTLCEEVLNDPHFDDSRNAWNSLLQFCDSAKHKYVIPCHAAEALDNTVLGLPKSEIGDFRKDILTRRSVYDELGMIRRFEQNHLRLDPSNSADGLRWWESSAGFAGGNYPLDAVAKSVSIEPEELLSMLQNDEVAFKTIMIRAGKFLYRVAVKSGSENTVQIGDIYELSKLGSAVLEAALAAYAHGLEAASQGSEHNCSSTAV